MNDTIMAEEMKPQETKAFVSKPYSNDERIKKEEEELEQLMKEQKGEVEEVEEEPSSSEEKHLKNAMVTCVVIHKKKNVSFKNNWKN